MQENGSGPAASARRRYEHEGEVYPGVTDVCSIVNKPALNRWKLKLGVEASREVMESANEFGTRVHAAVEAAVRARCDSSECRCGLSERDLKPYHDAAVDFLDSYVEEVVAVEMGLVSPRLKLGGTFDLYVKLQTGEMAVVDFKTSKAVYPEYALQTAAYCMLLYLNGHAVDKRLVVRLKKDEPGEYEVKPHDDDWRDARAFLGALELWHWRHGAYPPHEHGKLV